MTSRLPGNPSPQRETLSLWTEIGESVAPSGVRKLVLSTLMGVKPQIMDNSSRGICAFVSTCSS